jgi:iron complex transport system substrate-binding protein
VLSPEVAEILCALGVEDRIVGVTAECDFPQSLRKLPQIGNFGAVNFEKVANLNPSIVFSSALEQESIALDIKKLGLQVERSYPKSLDELRREIVRLGKVIGKEKEALELEDSLKVAIDAIRKKQTGKAIPKVYIEIYRDPLMSVSDASFVGELIETAGGDNIFSALERDYARVKAEDVIQLKPDIIICYSQDSLEGIHSRKGWQSIPAIKNKMIFFEKDISPDLIQRASPRSIEGMMALAVIYDRWREMGN